MHQSLITVPLFQPLPAASLLPGCADQQQAFPQDCPPAILPDIVRLLWEAVLPSHLPDPPETRAHPVMDPLERDGITTDEWLHSVWKIDSYGRISLNQDDMRFRTEGLHVFIQALAIWLFICSKQPDTFSVWHKNQLPCASHSKHIICSALDLFSFVNFLSLFFV